MEQIQESNLEFVFTDGHGIIKFSNFFNNTQHLDQIDWGVMVSKMWNDTIDDPDRKRRRQAEFLVKDRVPWAVFRGVGTFSKEYSEQVRTLLDQYGKNTPTAPKIKWYY